jgi:phosphatidate cytidylyltransferase
MLRQRVLTAVVLLALLLATIFMAPSAMLVAVFALVGAIAAREWAALSTWARAPSVALGYAALSFGLVMLAWWAHTRSAAWLPALLGLSLLNWLWVAWALAGYPQRVRPSVQSRWGIVQGLILVVPTIVACGHLQARPEGAWWLLFALFLVFAADVGAYFAGRRFGRHKLAPLISPGTTREGAVGGLLLCGVWAGVGLWLFKLTGGPALGFVLLCAVIGGFSILGDLFESACKRIANVKDSGNILPGHGGMLDRIDSVVAAVPLFVLGLMALGLA